MGPQAAVNAVHLNRLQAIEDDAERERVTAELREEYAADIDLLHLASELIIDAIVEPEDLREELVRRFALASRRRRERTPRRGSVRQIKPPQAPRSSDIIIPAVPRLSRAAK